MDFIVGNYLEQTKQSAVFASFIDTNYLINPLKVLRRLSKRFIDKKIIFESGYCSLIS
jgi:hypothetical protein